MWGGGGGKKDDAKRRATIKRYQLNVSKRDDSSGVGHFSLGCRMHLEEENVLNPNRGKALAAVTKY